MFLTRHKTALRDPAGTVAGRDQPLSVPDRHERYHQQHLAKNPNGYCGLGGTGVSCPIGLGVSSEG
jgi:peptide-methionine (S)-S-oxide reductase